MTKYSIGLRENNSEIAKEIVGKLPGVVTCSLVKQKLTVVFWPD